MAPFNAVRCRSRLSAETSRPTTVVNTESDSDSPTSRRSRLHSRKALYVSSSQSPLPKPEEVPFNAAGFQRLPLEVWIVVVRCLRFGSTAAEASRSPTNDYKNLCLVNRQFQMLVQPLLFEWLTIGLNFDSDDPPLVDIERLKEIEAYMQVSTESRWRSWPKHVVVNSGVPGDMRSELKDRDIAQLESLVSLIFMHLTDVRELHIADMKLTEGVQRHIHSFKRLRKLHIDLAWATPVDILLSEGQAVTLQDVRIDCVCCPAPILPLGIGLFGLSPSITTLSLGSDKSARSVYYHAEQYHPDHFANLRSLCVPIPTDAEGTRMFISFLIKCSTLTKLHFKRTTFRHRRDVPTQQLPCSVLPNLQTFIGPIDIAMELVHGRPLQHIHVFDTSDSFRSLSHHELALLMASPCLKSLKIHDIVWTDPIILSIAELAPRLESLALHFEDGFAHYVQWLRRDFINDVSQFKALDTLSFTHNPVQVRNGGISHQRFWDDAKDEVHSLLNELRDKCRDVQLRDFQLDFSRRWTLGVSDATSTSFSLI